MSKGEISYCDTHGFGYIEFSECQSEYSMYLDLDGQRMKPKTIKTGGIEK